MVTVEDALGVTVNKHAAFPAAEDALANIISEAEVSAVNAPLVSEPIVQAVDEAASKQ